jgi:hypothetical protein
MSDAPKKQYKADRFGALHEVRRVTTRQIIGAPSYVPEPPVEGGGWEIVGFAVEPGGAHFYVWEQAVRPWSADTGPE